MDIKAFLKEHKIKVGVIGSALVVTTTYGSCQITPPVEDDGPVVEETMEDEVAPEADDAMPEEGEAAAEEE